MNNRFVIALNHLLIAEEQKLTNEKQQYVDVKLSKEEVSQVMHLVSRYPKFKIQRRKLYTYGFSKN